MTMRSLSLKVIAVPVIIVAVAAVYFFVDPSASRWVPKCAFHEITGYDCPGCGSVCSTRCSMATSPPHGMPTHS
jgi:hypothetical protein